MTPEQAKAYERTMTALEAAFATAAAADTGAAQPSFQKFHERFTALRDAPADGRAQAQADFIAAAREITARADDPRVRATLVELADTLADEGIALDIALSPEPKSIEELQQQMFRREVKFPKFSRK